MTSVNLRSKRPNNPDNGRVNRPGSPVFGAPQCPLHQHWTASTEQMTPVRWKLRSDGGANSVAGAGFGDSGLGGGLTPV
jgi:hypothetical protein